MPSTWHLLWRASRRGGSKSAPLPPFHRCRAKRRPPGRSAPIRVRRQTRYRKTWQEAWVRWWLDFPVSIADNVAEVRHNHRARCGRSDVAKRGDIEIALRRLAPRIPSHEFAAVVDHAVDSPGLNLAFPETPPWLPFFASVPHTSPDYDELLRE